MGKTVHTGLDMGKEVHTGMTIGKAIQLSTNLSGGAAYTRFDGLSLRKMSDHKFEVSYLNNDDLDGSLETGRICPENL